MNDALDMLSDDPDAEELVLRRKRPEGREEPDYAQDYRKARDRNYVTTIKKFRVPPKMDAQELSKDLMQTADMHLHLRIQKTHWKELTSRLKAQDPFVRTSNVEYALSSVPFFAAIGFRQDLREAFGPVGAYAVIGLMLMAAFARPAIQAVMNKTKSGKRKLKHTWMGNVNRSVGPVFVKDRILENELGVENSAEFGRALSEAISFMRRYEEKAYKPGESPWELGSRDEIKPISKGKHKAAERHVRRLMDDFGMTVKDIEFSDHNTMQSKPGRFFRFSFDMYHGDKPIRTAVTIQVVPDIEYGRSAFSKHGLNIPRTRVDDLGLPVEEQDLEPIYIDHPIKIGQKDELIAKPFQHVKQERCENALKMMDENIWFHVQPEHLSDPEGQIVYATVYKPKKRPLEADKSTIERLDKLSAALDNEEYEEHELPSIQAEIDKITKSLRDLKSKNKKYRQQKARYDQVRAELIKTISEDERAELEQEKKSLENELFNDDRGEFLVYKARLGKDGLPPAMKKFKQVRRFTHALSFFQFIDEQITSQGFTRSRFWNVLKHHEMPFGIPVSKKMLRTAKRTLERMNEGTQFFVDRLRGGVYAFEQNSKGQYVLSVGSFGRTMTPPRQEHMQALKIGGHNEVLAYLDDLKKRESLIEDPFGDMAKFVAELEKMVAKMESAPIISCERQADAPALGSPD